ncbi:uncharacterized protein LOC143465866 [Clavelina lepadiformis]
MFKMFTVLILLALTGIHCTELHIFSYKNPTTGRQDVNCEVIPSKKLRIQCEISKDYARLNSCNEVLPLCSPQPNDCPSRPSELSNSGNGQSDSLPLKSLSPYKFCVDRNTSRFPMDIIQAKCICFDGCYMRPYPTVTRRHVTSKPVTIQTKVIVLNDVVSSVEDCNKSSCHIESLDVAVGCQCVRPKYVGG